MSTIATDGVILAADSMAGCGTLIRSFRKLLVLDDVAFAIVGESQDQPLFRDWWLRTKGIRPGPGDLLEPIPPLSEGFGAIMLRNDGRVSIFDSKAAPFEYGEKCHAMGSGRDFAIAAMHLGKSPIEAVALACELDCYTGLPIDAVRLQDGKFWAHHAPGLTRSPSGDVVEDCRCGIAGHSEPHRHEWKIGGIRIFPPTLANMATLARMERTRCELGCGCVVQGADTIAWCRLHREDHKCGSYKVTTGVRRPCALFGGHPGQHVGFDHHEQLRWP